MPPRSTRATRGKPLPTPSPSSTTGTKSGASTTALPTPNSMADDDLPGARSKRKAVSPAGSPPSKKLALGAPSSSGRRSKLSTEKTTSLDNLTLESSRKVKEEVKEEPEVITIDSGDTTEEEFPERITRTRSTRSTRAAAPKYTVDLVSDSEDSAPTRAKGKGKAKAEPKPNGKGKGKAKIEILSSDDDEFAESATDQPDDDYALDTEDEAERMKWATKASRAAAAKKANGSAAASASSGASTTPARATRGRKPKVQANVLGGKTHKSDAPRRSALARAAELRAKGSRATTAANTDMDETSEYGTLVDSDSSAVPTPDGATEADSDLSDLSDYKEEDDDDESEYNSDDSDEPIVVKKRKAKPPKKGAKGQRLDGEEGDELPDHWARPNKKKNAELEKELQRQKAEKAWVKAKERKLSLKHGRKLTQGEKNLIRLCLHHPELEDCWGDLAANIEPVKPVPMEAHPSLKLTLLPFQKESLYWMRKQEEGPWKGGMLADEMGMGKTIQTIALLLSEPRRKPSLVVAPVVALMQWKNEIETHAEGFTVCLWHGSGRMKAEQLKKFDVVLVSYGTLEASFRRQQTGFRKGNLVVTEKSPMHTFEWYRVILDEAHNIKERTTNAAKAAFALQAKYRWCLSGTPLQNRVGELYSLVRFLGADPFSYYFCKKCDCKSLHWKFSDKRSCDGCSHSPMEHVSLWNSEILHPIARYGIEEGGPGKTAFKKLKILLDRMMLRRTKLERADDLGLPPRTIVVRRDYFSPAEKEIYLSLFTNARRTFNTYLDQGTVLNNYSNIFSLITRMRQMACHPDLVLKSKTSTLAQKVNEGTVCRICNDAAEDAIVSACKHVFDRECIRQYLEVQQGQGHPPECPVCHIDISIDLEQEAVDVEENNKAARQGILSRLDIDNWKSSSKLEALVEELEKLRRKDCAIKSLVFSQFVSFLDLIAFRLQRAGFNICRLEGGMTPQQRDATIQHFMKNTQVTVFLISLKAGGVALNLTEASMVFMMDSWWNPSTEYQAMDRIHRLGQKRPVKVIKFVVQDSIEDQIVQLQAKKLAMTDAALSRDPDAALGKLTVEDLGFLFKL